MEVIRPCEAYFDEYLAACQESFDNNITEWMPLSPDAFEGWKERALKTYEMLESGIGLPDGIPRMVTYWCVENGKFIGEMQIRPWLEESEARAYGHIGYAVRYSKWGNGYGTQVLKCAIAALKERNVHPIYIACHVDNIGSNRCSLKCGFRFWEVTGRETNEPQNVYILE